MYFYTFDPSYMMVRIIRNIVTLLGKDQGSRRDWATLDVFILLCIERSLGTGPLKFQSSEGPVCFHPLDTQINSRVV
jgi:hypothetical protein